MHEKVARGVTLQTIMCFEMLPGGEGERASRARERVRVSRTMPAAMRG